MTAAQATTTSPFLRIANRIAVIAAPIPLIGCLVAEKIAGKVMQAKTTHGT